MALVFMQWQWVWINDVYFSAQNVRKSFSLPPSPPDHPRYRQWLLTDVQLVSEAQSWVDVLGWQKKKKPQHERQPPFSLRWHWLSCNAETGFGIDLLVATDHSQTPGSIWIWFLLFSSFCFLSSHLIQRACGTKCLIQPAHINSCSLADWLDPN